MILAATDKGDGSPNQPIAIALASWRRICEVMTRLEHDGMRMTLIQVFLVAVLLAAGAARARAASAGAGSVELHAFRFNDGEQLASLTLHYRTMGTPRRNGAGQVTNAVLLLHGTTGTAETMLAPAFEQALYGSGKPLDADRSFIVIPDGIGAGGSSKPSDGLHAHFPRYGYHDQVRAQHDMLAAMGITHLKLVLGTSMGGMQTWLWGETYPQDMDALVAIAATPAALNGRNAMWRLMIADAIRNDPDWHGGDYTADRPPRAWARTALPLFAVMTENPEQLQKKAPSRRDAAALVRSLSERVANVDANDFLYVFESSADYDPAARVDAVAKPMLTINFADDLLNPPELLDLPDAPNYTKVMLPAGAASYGHQTLTHPDLWAPALVHFLAQVPAWR